MSGLPLRLDLIAQILGNLRRKDRAHFRKLAGPCLDGEVRGCWESSGPQTMETVAGVLGMGDWLHSNGRLSDVQHP